jgi:hypothetical protein
MYCRNHLARIQNIGGKAKNNANILWRAATLQTIETKIGMFQKKKVLWLQKTDKSHCFLVGK